MTRGTKKLANALVKSLRPSFEGNETLDDVDWALTCVQLVELATRHHRLAEHACNRDLSAAEQREDEHIEVEIRILCERGLPWVRDRRDPNLWKPIRPKFHGDPRGATVKLAMPDGRYDDWGQEGICVPTREFS